ncbi:hypothetical protein KP509_26G034400 [Ceratopteris richardii]|uniref:Uncharacterized protein n=1 Tax=Ceratopteris richardii TaxID=49495 RepID=A0A8T2RMA3_CERRI|nr:hypothetical protein KP509_26G034400 [Ceratopteris richardii]
MRRNRCKVLLSAKACAWAGAISTVLSASLYLGDFMTTILTLKTYYHYQFVCPHLPQSSAVLRHDPVCRAVNVDPSLHNIGILFWWCVFWLVVGHLSYAVLFYYFSHRRTIPVAFVLPLVQLYRLLCVLMQTCSTQSLDEFQRSQRRLNSLHNYLVVALESVPQFILQSFVVSILGQYVRGSNDPNLREEQVPITLFISLIFSFASAVYNATVAMYCMDSDRTPLINRLWMSFMFGLETVVLTLENVVCYVALWQHDTDSLLSFPLTVVILNELVVSFLFSCAIIQRHYRRGLEKRIWAKLLQAIGLTAVTRLTGPSYVLILMQMSKAYLVCGTFVNASGMLSCPIFVFFWHKGFTSPCHGTLKADKTGHIMNVYINCTVIKATLLLSAAVFVLRMLTIACIYKDDVSSNRPEELRDILFENHGGLLPLECKISMRSHNVNSTTQVMQPKRDRARMLHGSIPLEWRYSRRSPTITSSTQVMKAVKEPSLFKNFIFLLIVFLIKRFNKYKI